MNKEKTHRPDSFLIFWYRYIEAVNRTRLEKLQPTLGELTSVVPNEICTSQKWEKEIWMRIHAT